MAIKVVAEQEFQVGVPTLVEGPSPTPPYAVFFEDDGDTGYLYGLDTSRSENPIVDAVQIYNVASVADKHLPSLVQLAWSVDDMKAVLLINEYPHAVFDFESQHAYCRTGFPPPSSTGWTKRGHQWDEKALDLFR